MYTTWLFAKPVTEVELAQGQEFFFKDFKVRIEAIDPRTCLQSDRFGCVEAIDEPSALLRISRIEDGHIDFLSLSSAESPAASAMGLQVEALWIDAQNQKVKIKLHVLDER